MLIGISDLDILVRYSHASGEIKFRISVESDQFSYSAS
jgi:hypothetical protein